MRPFDPDNPPLTGNEIWVSSGDHVRQKLAEHHTRVTARRLAFSNLDEHVHNRAFAASQLLCRAEVIERTPDYKVVRTGDDRAGWIFLYNMSLKTADYVVEHRACDWFGWHVTQCFFWRDPASPHVAGLTDRMFAYLLAKHEIIMSNPLQTNVHDFWLVQMTAVVQRENRVGIANLSQFSINWFDPVSHNYGEWLLAQGARGPGAPQEALRYVIAR